MTERRKFLRFDTVLNALCDIVKERRKATYEVKNISKEGALIIADKRLQEGAQINLSMEVPGDNVPVFASCQVAWQKESAKNFYETGLRFTKIDNPDKGRLLEYIYSQWLRILDRE